MAKVAGNYLGGQLIKMEALRNGFAEGIALTPDGMVSEGSGQNVFVVHQGALYTPTINGTLLHGITRYSILDAGARHGHPGARAGASARDALHRRRGVPHAAPRRR